jgi:predicted naringenin-chalcone synthase
MINPRTTTSSAEKSSAARIASVGVASPPCCLEQKKADSLFTQHYKTKVRPTGLKIMHQMLSHPSIKQRYISVETPDHIVTLKDEDPDSRVDRFAHWALELSASAIQDALKQRNLSVDDVSTLIVNTCTGYICPGISTYLIEKLGFSSHIKAYDLVGSGCAGAIPNIQLAEQVLQNNPGEIVVCVSVEICSATYQMGNDLSLIVSNAIFGDGAAAVVLWGRPEGVELISTMSYFDPKYRDAIRFVYRHGQLQNRLSSQLPKIIEEVVPRLITDVLQSNGLTIQDVKYWAIHSGGDKIIQGIKNKLNLTESQMEVTRHILAEYGNMSSPTVLFELHRILDGKPDRGAWVFMIAFGAGLAVHAYLLRI